MRNKLLTAFLLCCLSVPLPLAAKPLNIVAAENFYGSIAEQLGGPYVHVTSILTNPNQDPHLFSASPSTAKAIADADIIVYNGAGYDPWLERLLAAAQSKQHETIVVANLVGRKMGDNPHLWYAPATMSLYAKTLVKILANKDPGHKNYYYQQLTDFQSKQQNLLQQIAELKQRYPQTAIIATEPLFNDMATALGFKVYGEAFQWNIMNDTPPGPSQIQNFEDTLRHHLVQVLIYNKQVSSPLTERMQTLAKTAHIPSVGVSELQPASKTYFAWMQAELTEVAQALQTQQNTKGH